MENNWIIAVGILAAILELVGMWLVGNKNRICFPIFWLGGVCWIITALCTKPVTVGLLIVIPIATAINIRSWLKWRK